MDATLKHPFLERSHIAEPVSSQVNKCLVESCDVTGIVQTMHRLGTVDFVTLAGLHKCGPRLHLIRFPGVLAPYAKLRSAAPVSA